MKPIGFLLKPVKGISLDRDELSMPADMAKFIRNLCIDVTDNPGVDGAADGEGDNADTFTKPKANWLYIGNMKVPDGVNFAIGYKENKENNRGYVAVWNSRKNHFIYRVNGDGSGCQIIYKHPSLNFQLIPKHFISPTRWAVTSVCITEKGIVKNATYIILCDGYNEAKFIPEEDSILTDSFNSVTFPFFNSFDNTYDEGYITNLGVRAPVRKCIEIEPVINTTPGRTNKLIDKTWQWRIKYIDRWGRPSEHGIISTPFYVSATAGSDNCQRNSSSITRCVKLKIPAGDPTVEKIHLAYRNCNGDATNLTIPTDFSEYDSIDKYKNEPGKEWYERKHNGVLNVLTYNASDNTFDYIFCGDKECTAIPVEETNRLMNPLGIAPNGVLKLGNSIAFTNFMEDYPPFDNDILDKIKYSIKPPVEETCKPKTRKVRICAVIHNLWFQQNEPIWKSNDSDSQLAWGGLAHAFHTGGVVNPRTLFEGNIISDYKQGYPKDVKGFPGYFVGTGIVGYSKQYKFNNGVFTEDEFDDGRDNENKVNIMNDIVVENNIRLQVWEFDNVPEGNQIFRVASHEVEINGANYERTSTNVFGKMIASKYLGYTGVPENILNTDKEIIIPCTGDYDNQKDSNFYLAIADLTKPRGPSDIQLASKTVAVSGYVRDFYKNPIELLKGVILRTNYVIYTDHNGYYFFSQEAGLLPLSIDFQLKNKCGFTNKSITAIAAKLTVTDITTDKAQSDCKANNVVISGTIKDCNGVGLSGIIILLTRGQYATTDQSGIFTLIAHDSQIISESPTRNIDKLLIIQNGICTVTKCNDKCNICLDPIPVQLPVCSDRCDVIREYQIPGSLLIYSVLTLTTQRVLKSGGTFRAGLTAEDWMGRITFIQNSEKDTLNVPSWQQTGVMGFSKLFFDIDQTVVFPRWVKKISFWRTRNLNGDAFQWVIDKAEYVDATGNINPSSPNKIKLYITGLNNYNLLHNFKTNVTYELTKGDRVEFINKNDGTLFPAGINVLVTDSKDGNYLLIDYDTRLANLKGGEKIELQHPVDCQTKELYFEVGCPINILSNGKPEQFTGEINTFDTYLFNRKIAYKNASGINTMNIFSFSFEHHSPSDLWGDHCDDKGRVNTVNPYQRQKCSKTKGQVSNAFVSDKVLNGLGRFNDADMFVFDEQEWGGITGMVAKLNTVLVICEHANFITAFKEDRIRIDKGGNIRGDNNIFGRPERIKGSEFGCQPEDVNTIKEHNGIVCFVDSSNNALIQHNFGGAFDASEQAEMKSWISANIKHIQEYNNNSENPNIKYWHSVFDPKKKDFILTCFSIPKLVTTNLPLSNYVNDRREISYNENDTIAYRASEGILKNFYSFTAEYYGALFSDIKDNQLISFKNGLPYFHYQANSLPTEASNTFFGVKCLPVMEVILNVEPNKVKRYMWNEVHCREQLFFADRIITEARQLSRLLISQWEKRENFWTADFKCDVRTFIDPNVKSLAIPENVIFEGDTLYGKWIKIRYVGVPADSDKYCELNGFNIFVNGSEKSGTK